MGDEIGVRSIATNPVECGLLDLSVAEFDVVR